MAIKTKKITDLTTITTTNSFLLGSQNGVTGKISYSSIISEIEELINAKISSIQPTEPETVKVAQVEESEEVTALKNEITSLKNTLGELSVSYKNLNKKYNTYVQSTSDTILELQENVRLLSVAPQTTDTSALETRVAALESFVQKLQKDGYLTLAEIRKAAAETCPICTHTHEEVTETAAE